MEEPFCTVFPFTQVSGARQRTLLNLAERVERERIPGDVVECGVLDGGTAALMAYGTRTSGRAIHLFDAWQGLPQITREDGAASRKWVGQAVGSPKRVKSVLNKLRIDPSRVHFYIGWFEDTFPHVDVESVALLHIDCDFYAATALCLQTWYPRVTVGGFIQFDDYNSFQGCTLAVDDFLREHPELTMQSRGTHGTAYFVQKVEA